jgi:hypothetical protein
MPGMLVESATDELEIVLPFVERVGRRVHAEEAAA